MLNCTYGLGSVCELLRVWKMHTHLRIPTPSTPEVPKVPPVAFPMIGFAATPAGSKVNIVPSMMALPDSATLEMSAPARAVVNVFALAVVITAFTTLKIPPPLSVPVTVTNCPTAGVVPVSSVNVYVATPPVSAVAVMASCEAFGVVSTVHVPS